MHTYPIKLELNKNNSETALAKLRSKNQLSDLVTTRRTGSINILVMSHRGKGVRSLNILTRITDIAAGANKQSRRRVVLNFFFVGTYERVYATCFRPSIISVTPCHVDK